MLKISKIWFLNKNICVMENIEPFKNIEKYSIFFHMESST